MEWSPKDSLLVFSKNERLVIGVFLLLILLGGTSGYWLRHVISLEQVNTDPDRVVFQAEIEAWELRNQAIVDSLALRSIQRKEQYTNKNKNWNTSLGNTYSSKRNFPRSKTQAVEVDYSIPLPELGTLDANTVDTSVLFRLGVPPRVARRWVKFRDRGGTFVRREDVGKIYDMPDSTLKRIMPYLKSPDLKLGRRANATRTIVVNVNAASSTELQKIKGIGPFYAKQIINYRQKLGGFLSVDQVAETPGLRDSSFQSFKDKLSITQAEPRYIRINQANERQLSNHPYLSRKQAEIIILNRKNHGNFKSRDDLLATIVLDTQTVDKLMPYLDFVD